MLIVANTSELNNTDTRVFFIGEPLAMNAASHKNTSTRLPLLAAIFVALVCVAIVGLSCWREWSARDLDLKHAEVEMANLTRSLTGHAEDTIELGESILAGIVSGLETDGINPARIGRLQTLFALRKAKLGRIHGLFVYDETGHWLATTETLNFAELNNSDRAYFQHHRESADRKMLIGQPVLSRSGGQWVTTLSRRINHPDGSFAGVVLATVDANYFSQFYGQFDIGANGTISLMSADGIIMARSPDDGTSVGRDLSAGPLFKDMDSRASSGVYYYRSPVDGLQRLGFYQRSSHYPLMILAAKAQSDVLARWRKEAFARMTLVLGLVGLIAVIGFYLVRQMQGRQRMVAALESKEANFRVLAEGSSDMVTRIGLDERVYYASPSSVRIVGWRPDQLVGTPALAGVNPEDLPGVLETVAALKRGEAEEARISYRTRHREKSQIWVETTLRITRKATGEIDGVVAISRDMTEQKNLEGKLETLATEDSLTGLANRRRFDERLQEEWARAYRDGKPLALLMIDVDHFKKFNDQYGHPAGDACLRSVAKILAAEARRPGDLAVRYGGEEFVLLLPNTDAGGCELVGERIRAGLRKLCVIHALNPPSKRVTVSLGGATMRPNAQRSAESSSLITAADRALYAAKDGGRDRLVMSGQVVALPAVSAAR
jgi:diguanylate cyclase (GGDEF)-like protein/PAS domain S-box-containing protein